MLGENRLGVQLREGRQKNPHKFEWVTYVNFLSYNILLIMKMMVENLVMCEIFFKRVSTRCINYDDLCAYMLYFLHISLLFVVLFQIISLFILRIYPSGNILFVQNKNQNI